MRVFSDEEGLGYTLLFLARCFMRHMVSLDLYAVAPANPGLSLCTWYLGFSNRRLGLFRMLNGPDLSVCLGSGFSVVCPLNTRAWILRCYGSLSAERGGVCCIPFLPLVARYKPV